MRITLAHRTTQSEAIKKINSYLDDLMQRKFSMATITDPNKNWEGNIMRFSFGVNIMFFNLDFSGIVIVTDSEVVGESDLPELVSRFVSEEKIREVITRKFNELFAV